jgi:hypothetical protein
VISDVSSIVGCRRDNEWSRAVSQRGLIGSL